MDPQSPPKRMTRARAAAKASTSSSSSSSTKPTRVVTAAAKAKATRTTPAPASAPTSTAAPAKRKLRSDDTELDEDRDELELEQPEPAAMKPARATRGRPKKAAEPQPGAAETKTESAAPAPRATRGRPRKQAVPDPAPLKEEPARATRITRTKKTQTETDQVEVSAEPAKKPARSRAGTLPKPAVKKTVTFEEPEKENIDPEATAKGKSTAKAAETSTGLRAKPVRRAASTARSTRTGTRAGSTADKKDGKAPTPLSPKKVTQLRVPRDNAESDDELGAMEKTPLNPLMRSPVRLPAAASGATKKAEPSLDSRPESTMLKAPEYPSIILGSPARRLPPSPHKESMMKSPARRQEGPHQLAGSAINPDASAPQSLKASLLQSPAKRPQMSMKTLDFGGSALDDGGRSPFKMSLLQSPAKRPLSPVKTLALPRPAEVSTASQSPALKPTFLAAPAPPSVAEDATTEDSMEEELKDALEGAEQDGVPSSPTRLRFPGRLSAVLPRHADPALREGMLPVNESSEEVQGSSLGDEAHDDATDPMEIDENTPQEASDAASRRSTTPPHSPPKPSGMFALRDKDLKPFEDADSESDDDELPAGRAQMNDSPFGAVPATPCPSGSSRTPKSGLARTAASGRSTAKRPRVDQYGFTPLAEQLNGWRANSAVKNTSNAHVEEESFVADEATFIVAEETPAKPTFFEDEMSVRPSADTEEAAVVVEAAPVQEGSAENEVEMPEFDDIPVTQEDVDLAAEANEMSLMEGEHIEDAVNNTQNSADDTASEASQEYGDENAMPIDPALLAQGHSSPAVPPVTPQRTIGMRSFHTVSKVPLKPADESTPRPTLKKRSLSISRLPTSVQRPNKGLARNATVISYSPSKRKDRRQSDVFDVVAAEAEEQQQQQQQHDDERSRASSAPPPCTPTKSEVGWSTAGTPARTPRRDLNPALLRGAVVFVDVHTTEGADASGIFVELLTQMGARCVKSWSWNPSSPPSQDGPSSSSSSSSKVGITHVVYKDGGKRTLEKVRETGGVVQCVGVSWVLDCERENQWLDEAPYYIDTSMVPRGGARRRKSMEPRALANLNGMLVSSPAKTGQGHAASITPGRECQTAPSTPANNNRRASALWVRTPEDQQRGVDAEHDRDADADADADSDAGVDYDYDYSAWDAAGLLTPVPKTPAPEAVARFAASLAPATPTGQVMYGEHDDDGDGESIMAREREELMTRTCPPKSTSSIYGELGGGGVLAREKDERVLMRLMAARRKSLQFAPKVASPLSKAWN